MIALDAPAARAHSTRSRHSRDSGDSGGAGDPDSEDADHGAVAAVADDLILFARRARELGDAEVGVAIRAHARTGDTAVSMAISTPVAERKDRRIVFLTGPLGRLRAALSAASFVLETLREAGHDAGAKDAVARDA